MPVAVGMACPHHMLTLQRGVPPVNTSASYLRLCSITSLISSTLTWWQSLNMAPLIGRTMVGSGYCLLCQYSGISSLVIRLIRTPRLKAKMTAETGLNKKDICWLSSQEDNYSSLPEERWIDTEWQNTHTHTHTHMSTSVFCFYSMGDPHLSSSSPHHKRVGQQNYTLPPTSCLFFLPTKSLSQIIRTYYTC